MESAANISMSHYGVRHNLRHNHRLLVVCFLLSFCYFTFGYDGYIYAGIIAMPSFIITFGSMTAKGPVLTATEQSIVSSIPVAGSLLGFALIALMTDRYGRKPTIYVACVIGLIGMAMQTAGVSLAVITIGRTIASMSSFVTVNMGLTLSAELAPACLRGAILTLSAVSIGVAGIIASGINYGTYAILNSLAWRLPIGLQLLGPIMIAAGAFFVMESPTRYLMRDEYEKARESLAYVRQGYTEAEITSELENMQRQRAVHLQTESSTPQPKPSPLEIFRGPNLRRTILASSFVVIIQLSGLAFATVYATVFFVQISAANPFLLVLALSILEWGGACTGQVLIEVLGRRRQALFATSVIFVLNITIGGLAFAAGPTNRPVVTAIAALCMVVGFFLAATFSPLQWCAVAEFPTARLRNLTTAYSTLNSSLASLVVSYVLPYLTNADAADLGPKVYLVFAGFMGLAFIWAYFCYPEIKGRSLAEIDEMFEAGVPARKFKGYTCVNTLEHSATVVGKAVEAGIIAEDAAHIEAVEEQVGEGGKH